MKLDLQPSYLYTKYDPPGNTHNLLALSCCATAIAWPLPCTRSAPYSLYLLAIDPLSTARTPPRFTMASPTTVRLRHHTESTLAATRTLHEDMDMTHGTPCTPLPLQRIITNMSTWTRRRLTDATTTDRANSHDSLTHLTPPDDDLDEFQRCTSAPSLPSTTSFHHLANDSLPSPSMSLRRTIVPPLRRIIQRPHGPPRGTSRVATPGQALNS